MSMQYPLAQANHGVAQDRSEKVSAQHSAADIAGITSRCSILPLLSSCFEVHYNQDTRRAAVC